MQKSFVSVFVFNALKPDSLPVMFDIFNIVKPSMINKLIISKKQTKNKRNNPGSGSGFGVRA
tara:strand:+ start:52 stop:237 length:186 start_codon:yes stop_codon:yes gene_type:complete